LPHLYGSHTAIMDYEPIMAEYDGRFARYFSPSIFMSGRTCSQQTGELLIRDRIRGFLLFHTQEEPGFEVFYELLESGISSMIIGNEGLGDWTIRRGISNAVRQRQNQLEERHYHDCQPLLEDGGTGLPFENAVLFYGYLLASAISRLNMPFATRIEGVLAEGCLPCGYQKPFPNGNLAILIPNL
jgi:hypothetical protein